MTIFFRISGSEIISEALQDSCDAYRKGRTDINTFVVDDEVFREIPGSPFAYWSSDSLRKNFSTLPLFESGERFARVGLQTSDDFRFVRTAWEVPAPKSSKRWYSFVRGGTASRFYGNLSLAVNWADDGAELKAWASKVNGGKHWSRNIRSPEHYGKAGITWPLRASRLSPYPMPRDSIFSTRGTVAFESEGALAELFGLMTSAAFDYLFKLLLGRFGHPEFSIGAVQRMPVPVHNEFGLGCRAIRAWSIQRTLDSIEETSHAFLLPEILRPRLGGFNPASFETEITTIQSEIDDIAFDLYGFSENDRASVRDSLNSSSQDDNGDEVDDEDSVSPIDQTVGLLSWSVGVVFARFDWRLATAEREAPEDPEPFDPLPTKSPGMLPDAAEPFHAHSGMLVDDEEHPHDLPNLLEEVLQRVDAPVQVDTRRWLQREFFPFHLQRYSKSRRKAPIYWPLSTLSGSYTLWLYYPALTSQTLFTAVNDFIEPKLKQVRGDLESLRVKGNARSKQEEKQLEVVSDLSQELADLRDALLAIAPKYSPNHDDGVQITAAPLWQLFRHKPWQKVLNDTWGKLEQGEYDWSHLAMNYWPERVLRKCHQDRSLAIAHDVEDTFWHEVEVPVMRGKKPTGETKLEWQPKALTDDELDALIQAKIKERCA